MGGLLDNRPGRVPTAVAVERAFHQDAIRDAPPAPATASRDHRVPRERAVDRAYDPLWRPVVREERGTGWLGNPRTARAPHLHAGRVGAVRRPTGDRDDAPVDLVLAHEPVVPALAAPTAGRAIADNFTTEDVVELAALVDLLLEPLDDRLE